MPSVILNKKIFEGLVGKKLSPDQLKDRISMLGTDLEKIEGDEIHVEIFPQRPDMLSEQGFARAFSSFIGVKTGLRSYKIEKSDEKVIIDRSVAEVRPFTACAIVKDLKFDDEKIRELIQIQEKLHITYGRNRKKAAIGIYPMEKIKMPITYFAEDPKKITFRPLEFPKEITALQVLSQHPTGRDYAHLLEGKKKFPFFKDADGQILSMPPIINAHNTGKVSEKTKEVFIECSGFDFNTLSICLNIIVTTLSDMGGKVQSMTLEYPDKKRTTPDLEPLKMDLDIGYTNRILGLELSEKDIKTLLEKMGFGYDMKAKKEKVLVPAYRSDILHQIDLVEDVAIAYGYENFEPLIPNVATIGEESEFEIFKRRIANILAGLGLLETNSFHLTNEDDHNRKMGVDLRFIEIENAVNIEYNILRSWITPDMMRILSENTNKAYPQNIFQIGTIFKHNEDMETNVEENDRLAVCLCGSDSNFTKIKQVLDALANALDIKYGSKETDHGSFIPGRVARISVKDKEVAYIGEISPNVLSNWNLQMPVACFELNLSDLFSITIQKK